MANALMVLWVSVCSGTAAVYSVKDLGPIRDLAGRTESGPKGINHGGAAAGVNVVNGFYRALFYGGAWTNLGTLGGSESLSAGVNDAGQIVGYSVDSDGMSRGFIWTAGGTDGAPGNPQMKALGTLSGGSAQAFGINNNRGVCGYSDVVVKSKVEQHAVVWRNGTATDIGVLGTLPNSFGYGINSSGHVAGTAYNASYSSAHAFLYNGTSVVELGGLGGADASALAINDADQITGYATTSSGFDHAFRYSGGTMRDLGTLGGNYSYGLGINAHGVIVGGSFIDTGDSIYHAFVWSNNVMQDLSALVDATGTGWVLVEARAINDVGQIVGSGTYGGANHGFLLTPLQTNTPLRITESTLSGATMVIKFTTVPNAKYTIEATATILGGWISVVTDIPGTGQIVEVMAPAPTSVANQFFRVRRTL